MNRMLVMSWGGVISQRVDVKSHVVHMMSYILWLCYPYDEGFMIDNLGVITDIQWMYCQI